MRGELPRHGPEHRGVHVAHLRRGHREGALPHLQRAASARGKTLFLTLQATERMVEKLKAEAHDPSQVQEHQLMLIYSLVIFYNISACYQR